MGWARLDDGWHDHPKVVGAGTDAAGLWVMCLTWAHANRRGNTRPGFVPKAVVGRFAATKAPRLARRLVEVGLFDPAQDGDGWLIHDFSDYLPRYDPAKAADAGKAGAGKRWKNGRGGPPEEPPPDGEPPPDPMANRHQTDSGSPSNRHQTDSEPLANRHRTDDGSPSNRYRENGSRVDAAASARRNPDPVPEPVPRGPTLGAPLALGTARARASDRPTEHPDRSPAQQIAAIYRAGVPLADHGRALRVIAQALEAYPAEQVRAGVIQLVAEERGCSPDALRIAILDARGTRRRAGPARPGNPYLDDLRAAAQSPGAALYVVPALEAR